MKYPISFIYRIILPCGGFFEDREDNIWAYRGTNKRSKGYGFVVGEDDEMYSMLIKYAILKRL